MFPTSGAAPKSDAIRARFLSIFQAFFENQPNFNIE